MRYNIQTKASGIQYAAPNYGQVSELAKQETNDCVVRATAACFNVPYDKAHAWVKKYFKRKDKKGVVGTFKYMDAIKSKWNQKVTRFGEKVGDEIKVVTRYKLRGEEIVREMTVGTFLKKFPSGNYFIIVKGHAFCIKNGVVIGNRQDGDKVRARIQHVYKIG